MHYFHRNDTSSQKQSISKLVNKKLLISGKGLHAFFPILLKALVKFFLISNVVYTKKRRGAEP